MDDAIKTADYAISNNTDGVLYTNEAGGMDGGLFKGILVRYLTQLMREGNLTDIKRAEYAEVINANAEALRRRGVNYENNTVSTNWAMPPGVATDFSTQLSGTMLVEAATTLDKVGVYTAADYDGVRAFLGQGSYTTADLVALGVSDDALSSLTVPNGYRVRIFEDDNFMGESENYVVNDAGITGWNDRVSSLIVEANDGVSTFATDGSTAPMIYPNPTSGWVTFEFDGARADVSIVDASGKIVVRARTLANGAALDVSHLAVGAYVVTVQTTSGTLTRKLIKR